MIKYLSYCLINTHLSYYGPNCTKLDNMEEVCSERITLKILNRGCRKNQTLLKHLKDYWKTRKMGEKKDKITLLEKLPLKQNPPQICHL